MASPSSEHVVLVNEQNEVLGTVPKATVHNAETPLHRAFSIFLFNTNGELLLQQRSKHKKTWPLVWSNSCCGHPQLGEKTIDAAHRRLDEELGLQDIALYEILPNYRYRAELNGIVENEICPVFVGFTTSQPTPDANEVEQIQWVAWGEFIHEINRDDSPYSPWSIKEARLLCTNQKFKKLYKRYTNS